MRPARLTAIACAAASVAVAATPSAAGAAPLPAATKRALPDQAVFTATLSGSQVTTWETHDPRDVNDPCDGGSDSYGDQTVKFKVPGKFRLTVYKPDKKEPNLLFTHGRPAFTTRPAVLAADLTASRNADIKPDYPPPGACPGGNGGGGDYTPVPRDCGERAGTFNPTIFYDTPASVDDDLFVPLPGPLPDKDYLKVGGRLFSWKDPKGGTTSSLDGTFENCPWSLAEAYVERSGDLWIAPEKFKEANLFNPRKKSFVISGGDVVDRSGPKTTGQTIVTWNLRLKRVK